MSYIDGFVVPVPKGNKQRYKEVAAYAAPIFLEHGALRVVEQRLPPPLVPRFVAVLGLRQRLGEQLASRLLRGALGRPVPDGPAMHRLADGHQVRTRERLHSLGQ